MDKWIWNQETILLIAGLAAALLILLWVTLLILWKRKQERPLYVDDMPGVEFEDFCVELLQQNGFLELEKTRATGDYGVDILAQKDGISYAIQCKCYHSPVGVKAVQEAYAGRDYYDCMVGVVMSNQYFTTPAVDAAKKLKIVLWDRGYLESMMEE